MNTQIDIRHGEFHRKSHRACLILAATFSLLSSSLLNMERAEAAAGRHRASGGGGGGGGGGGYSPLPPNASPLDHNNRAVSYGRAGNWDAAVKEHEIALNGDPYNGTFRMNLSGAYLRYGQALMGKHNWQAAIQRFHMALYVDQNNIAANERLSECWKALGKDPYNADFRRDVAERYETEANYPEAIAEYRCLVRQTDSGRDHAALGSALRKQGQSVPARAVEGFIELKIAIGKDWPRDKQLELGKAHCELGDALKELAFKARDDGRKDTAMKRLANAGIEYRRAATLMHNQNLEGARGLVEVAREAVAINPRSFDNHLMLAGGYQLEGDFERAKKEYETCWALQPQSQKLAAARLSFHRAVVTSPGVPLMVIAASVQKVEDMLKKNPNDAELLYIYGRGKDALGDPATATQAYEYARKISPYMPELQNPRGKGAAQPMVSGNGVVASGLPGQPAGTLGQPGALPGQPAVPGQQGLPGQPGATGQPAVAAAPPVNPNAAALASIQTKLNSGDTEGSLKELMALVDKTPGDGNAWFLVGQANEKKGELDDASVAYRQATYMLKGDPRVPEAQKRVDNLRAKPYIQKAEDAMRQNNWVDAEDALRQAISVSPEEADPRRKLIDVLKRQNKTKEIEQETNSLNKLLTPISTTK